MRSRLSGFRPHVLSRAAIALSLSLPISVQPTSRVAAQSIVYDPWNYSQTLLSAARALDQINNQIRSLENQAQMLINQARNLERLPTSVAGQLTSTIARLNGLIAQAKGLSFDVQKAQADFERLYPRQYTAAASSDRLVQDATARWDNSHEGLKQALTTQATIASTIDEDRQTLGTLMANSSAAIGSVQAQQSTNELLGLQLKQALQAQTLSLAQARADTLRAAEQQASVAAAQERFVRFIGDGHAYTSGK
ncbi:P-type conjugative transfer protein TrbJ [Bradyrhizobium cenepequi]|uniref:P-type conjugative transfer protein TrbJ n=1 Tax=Bradyrhizobium cenepequi TaxID=2821403 RepID=UPI001CE27B72|nr:P-type conjugative transfer protein TrbJ [Bradyrhizobium cenepequi]MCA6113037.1 P-type conjugative transfer protein TrbJ [Bradyrhizobium cenepequi]